MSLRSVTLEELSVYKISLFSFLSYLNNTKSLIVSFTDNIEQAYKILDKWNLCETKVNEAIEILEEIKNELI